MCAVPYGVVVSWCMVFCDFFGNYIILECVNYSGMRTVVFSLKGNIEDYYDTKQRRGSLGGIRLVRTISSIDGKHTDTLRLCVAVL